MHRNFFLPDVEDWCGGSHQSVFLIVAVW
jgi:hypothetical protein